MKHFHQDDDDDIVWSAGKINSIEITILVRQHNCRYQKVWDRTAGLGQENNLNEIKKLPWKIMRIFLRNFFGKYFAKYLVMSKNVRIFAYRKKRKHKNKHTKNQQVMGYTKIGIFIGQNPTEKEKKELFRNFGKDIRFCVAFTQRVDCMRNQTVIKWGYPSDEYVHVMEDYQQYNFYKTRLEAERDAAILPKITNKKYIDVFIIER